MPYSYKGSISFGLVYIPVVLVAAAKSKDVRFHLLDRKTMSRVRYKKTCVDCGDREVKNEDVVKGYEYREGEYVVLEEEDFEKIKTQKQKTVAIEQFADLEEIDPVYYEKCYYVRPTGAERAYALLIAAMQAENKVGIAKTVLGNKETLIAIRARNGRMLLSTLYFPEEIQAEEPLKEESLDEKELELARSLIANMSAPFDPKKYRDEYRERVMQAIEAKIAGKQIQAPKERPAAKVTDLLDALTKSLRSVEPAKSRTPAPRKRPEKRANAR